MVGFNGNDPVFLLKGVVVIDQIGLDDQPTTGPWAVGTGSTLDTTLVRNPSVRVGTTDWTLGWTAFPEN